MRKDVASEPVIGGGPMRTSVTHSYLVEVGLVAILMGGVMVVVIAVVDALAGGVGLRPW